MVRKASREISSVSLLFQLLVPPYPSITVHSKDSGAILSTMVYAPHTRCAYHISQFCHDQYGKALVLVHGSKTKLRQILSDPYFLVLQSISAASMQFRKWTLPLGPMFNPPSTQSRSFDGYGARCRRTMLNGRIS